jgi:hypothetical protein
MWQTQHDSCFLFEAKRFIMLDFKIVKQFLFEAKKFIMDVAGRWLFLLIICSGIGG